MSLHVIVGAGPVGSATARLLAEHGELVRVVTRRGDILTTEVRGSDYLGAGSQSLLTMLVLPKVLAGARARVPADLDAAHSWTYVGDVARLLIRVATDERAWGRAWHVPTAAAVSIRDIATRACAMTDAPTPRLSTMPAAILRLGGLGNPLVRELRETQYQFRRPFVLDSSASTTTFGIQPISFETALRETVERITGELA